MKLCRVIIPFTDKVTGKFHHENDEIVLTDERIAEIKSVNMNMVFVLGEADAKATEPKTEPVAEAETEGEEKPKRTKKSK